MTTDKKSRFPAWLLPVILLALVGLAAAWFFSTHKLVTEEDRLKLTRDARSNSYFAAQLYLEKLGVPVETQKGRDVLINLPSTDDVVIVRDIGYSFNEKRIAAMHDWLDQGGHIITFANHYYDSDDDEDNKALRGNRLLDDVGVYLQQMDDVDSEDSSESERDESDSSVDETATKPDETASGDDLVKDSDSGVDRELDIENTPIDHTGENCEAFNTCDMVNEQVLVDDSETLDKGTGNSEQSYDETTEINSQNTTKNKAPADSLETKKADVSEEAAEKIVQPKASGKESDDLPDDLPEALQEILKQQRETQQAQEVEFALGKRKVTVHMGTGDGLWIEDDVNVVNQQSSKHDSGIDQIYMAEVGFKNGGRLTVLTQDDFMKNPLPDIKKDDVAGTLKEIMNKQTTGLSGVDNAYLLWYLVKDDNKVWLLPRIDAPSLSQLLWQRARYAVISFTVLLLAWLLWQFGRFGPIRQHVFRSRRNILEHLDMIGNFAWRVDKAEQLFQSNRDTVKQLCVQRHPQLSGKLGHEFSEMLAERIDMSSSDIQKALFSAWRNETGFIEYSHLLQTLREKL